MRILLFFIFLASLSMANQDIAFRVNALAFPLSDFDKQFMVSLEQYKKDILVSNEGNLTVQELERLKYGVLDTLIDKAVILDFSKKNNINVSLAKVKERLRDMKQKYPSANAFEKQLKSDGIKTSQVMDALRFQLTQEAILDKTFKKETFMVTSKDILAYIRLKNISLFPLIYDITLAVTDNKKWLESLKPEELNLSAWPGLRLNMEYSSFNMLTADSDLDFAMQSFLDTLEVNVLSSTCPFDDSNYYRARINQIQLQIPQNYKGLIDGIKEVIRAEKRSQKLETWLKEQRKKTFVKVNIRAFPDFYHREPRGTLN